MALVDSSADINAIKYETWDSLKNKSKLENTELKMTTFAGDKKGALGYCTLDLCINKTNARHRFYVMKLGRMTESILLGTPWQRTYNSAINWKEDGINFEVNKQKMFETFIPKDCYTDETDSEDDTSDNESSPTRIQSAEAILDCHDLKLTPSHNTTALKRPDQGNQGHTTIWIPKRLKEAQKGNSRIWVPKHLAASSTQQISHKGTQATYVVQGWENQHQIFKQCRRVKYYFDAKKAAKRVRKRWVKKATLRAQGYYEGHTSLWLPKQSQVAIEQPSATQQKASSKAKPKQKWRPKQTAVQSPIQKQPAQVPRPLTQRPKASRQEKGKWVPKMKCILESPKIDIPLKIPVIEDSVPKNIQAGSSSGLLGERHPSWTSKIIDYTKKTSEHCTSFAIKNPWTVLLQDPAALHHSSLTHAFIVKHIRPHYKAIQ